MTYDPCPGSGLDVLSVPYVVNMLTDKDRADYARRVQNYRDEGLEEAAAHTEQLLAEWEREQGQSRLADVCSVCRDPWVSVTKKGKARRHRRKIPYEFTLERAQELTRQITVLQEELQRTMMHLNRSYPLAR